MKKFLILGIFFAGMMSCASNENDGTSEKAEAPLSFDNHRNCASHTVLEQQLAADPGRQAVLDEIERFTEQAIASGNFNANRAVVTIPVVVNVLYKTAAQNISTAQIQSQINVLNQDFSATNSDYNLIPSVFTGVASGNIEIQFVLSSTVRKQTNKTSWSANDAMKKASQGGINPTTPTTHLNMWVCNLGQGLLGYAQFPGGSAATDGVVCDDNAFGNTGTASAPFNKGRTATHEVGHWLNLRHIWGDATCGNDLVSDTPVHNASNGGCPTQPHFSTCSGQPREMTMNYMDYTNDVCMYMFTAGQKARMLTTLAPGGSRNSYAN